MAYGAFECVSVQGIACAVPDQLVKNQEYNLEFGEGAVKRFAKTAGVEERYLVSSKQTTSDLCYVAAEQLLDHLGWKRDSIDAVFLITQTPDYRMPASACILQHRLGLSQNCMAFDMNLGCSSYPYGMFVASSFLQNPGMRRVLFLTGDMYRGLSKDKATAMLFGSAGSATALETGKQSMRFILKTDGANYDKLIAPFPSHRHFSAEEVNKRVDADASYSECTEWIIMDGTAIINFVLFDVIETFKEFFDRYNVSVEDYDYCILHQANLLALKTMAKRLNVPMTKLPISIDRYGNTSGCSVPLTLVDLCEKLPEQKQLQLLLSGFGVGLSWGVMDMTIDTKMVLPMIRTDAYFKDAYRP